MIQDTATHHRYTAPKKDMHRFLGSYLSMFIFNSIHYISQLFLGKLSHIKNINVYIYNIYILFMCV